MLSGKEFEKDFSKPFLENLHKIDEHLIRLFDNTAGFKNIKNPCDFILATEMGTMLLELKVTQSKSISINALTDFQRESLLIANKKPSVFGFIIVYFEKLNVVAAIDIDTMVFLIEKDKRLSVNYEQRKEFFKVIPHEKKIKRLSFEVDEVVKALNEYAGR